MCCLVLVPSIDKCLTIIDKHPAFFRDAHTSHFDPFKLKEEAYSRAVGDDDEASMTSWESEMSKLSPTFLFLDTIMLICAPLKYWMLSSKIEDVNTESKGLFRSSLIQNER